MEWDKFSLSQSQPLYKNGIDLESVQFKITDYYCSCHLAEKIKECHGFELNAFVVINFFLILQTATIYVFSSSHKSILKELHFHRLFRHMSK